MFHLFLGYLSMRLETSYHVSIQFSAYEDIQYKLRQDEIVPMLNCNTIRKHVGVKL
jgi:hypothetical protein